MRKISLVVVAGLSVASVAGGSWAQGSGDTLAGGSLGSHAAALGSMSKSDTKLNATSGDLGGLTNSLSSANALSSPMTNASLAGALKSGNVAAATVGAAPAPATGDHANVFTNAMGSNSLGNAFQSSLSNGAAGATAPGKSNAIAIIGSGSTTGLAGAIGDKRSLSDQRLGK